MSHNLVLADWGTSNLRIWVLNETGQVCARTTSTDGADTLSSSAYAPLLRARLETLGIAPTTPVPVVVCGMAGARRGWCEADYVAVPAPPLACLNQAVSIFEAGLDVRILPGLAQNTADEPDVMRGEETQLLGFHKAEPNFSGIVCLPGTHNKWVRVTQGQVMAFHTAMTGEIFALLSRHSVLRHVINGETHFAPGEPGFTAGLAEVFAKPSQWPLALFSIRAAGLLHGQTGKGAAARLSGLLVGVEVAAALSSMPGTCEVALLASGALSPLYAQAVAQAGWQCRLFDADSLTLAGLQHAARQLFPAFFKG